MDHVFTVTGMTCGHCEKTVTQAVTRLDGNAKVQIDRNANRVQVQSDQPAAELAQAIAEQGYAVNAVN